MDGSLFPVVLFLILISMWCQNTGFMYELINLTKERTSYLLKIQFAIVLMTGPPVLWNCILISYYKNLSSDFLKDEKQFEAESNCLAAFVP